MYVEDHITSMRQQRVETPYGWLICFESRPLQGIPPNGKGPHLLFFSEENKARIFVSDRKKFYGEEPLSVVGVDSPETLKSMALDPSGDTRYSAPPCGIVLDFDHSTAKALKIISPLDVKSMLPVEFTGALGIKPVQAVEIQNEPTLRVQKIEPWDLSEKIAPGSVEAADQSTLQVPGGEQVPILEPPPQPRKKRPPTIVLITCGVLLALGLLLLCIGAIWFGLRGGTFPALPSRNTPTSIPTATATATPTSIPTPTATPITWIVNVEDDFSYNQNYWPVGFDEGQYGSSNLAIKNGTLVFTLESVDSCWYWWHPDIPTFSDFIASIDILRVDGSTTGDYGIVFRADGDANSFYYFAINDANQEFAVFRNQYDIWTTVVDWTANSVIGVGNTNHIEIIAMDSHFIFSINGVEVGQADNAGLASGKLGVMVQLYDSNDKITVQYDNLDLHGNP